MSGPGDLAVFSAASGTTIVAEICRQLGVPVAPREERVFEDGEHKTRPLESVRGRDVYVVESLHGDEQLSVNDKLMRVLFFIACLRDLGAGRVTVVAPYLCYSRKDMRTKPRDPVTTRYLAELFEAVGANRIVTVDVHNRAAYENAFRIPAEHLSAATLLVEAIAPFIAEREAVVVSPDAGGVKRAERFRVALERRVGRAVPLAFVEKFRSEGQVRGGTVVGDVAGRVAILVDDLISSGRTLAMGAKACRGRGAAGVCAAATHAVFASDAADVLGASDLERIIVLDTVPVASCLPDSLLGRLDVRPCAPLLAVAIQRLHVDGSLGEFEQ